MVLNLKMSRSIHEAQCLPASDVVILHILKFNGAALGNNKRETTFRHVPLIALKIRSNVLTYTAIASIILLSSVQNLFYTYSRTHLSVISRLKMLKMLTNLRKSFEMVDPGVTDSGTHFPF